MNSIRITVQARAGAGKTTVLREIHKHLRSLGLQAVVVSEDDGSGHRPEEAHQNALATLVKRGVTIRMHEVVQATPPLPDHSY